MLAHMFADSFNKMQIVHTGCAVQYISYRTAICFAVLKYSLVHHLQNCNMFCCTKVLFDRMIIVVYDVPITKDFKQNM